jgi:hypothetical protein
MDGATLPDFPDMPTGLTCANLKGIAESGILSAEDCAGIQSLSAYCCPTCSLCGEGNAMTKPDNKLPQDFCDDSDMDRSLRALQEDEDMSLPATCGGFVEYFQTLELLELCDIFGPLIVEGFKDEGFDVQLYCGCENAAASTNVSLREKGED